MKSLTLVLLAATVVRYSMGGDITVTAAPDGATLRTMGGEIRVRSSGGRVIAQTMGGGIRADRVEGSIEAGTMGGQVRVEVVGNGANRMIALSTMGGDVELTLPADFGAAFDVELERDDEEDHGTIVSDFPLKISAWHHRRWFRNSTLFTARGTVGSGANRVRIRVHGGDVRIRRK